MFYGKRRKEIVGGELATTNQRMELQAAIAGLKQIKVDKRREVTVYTDSQYLHHTMTKPRRRPPKANADLIANDDGVLDDARAPRRFYASPAVHLIG